MIRHTGGLALGATSTRSSSSSRAIGERLRQRLDPELLALGADEQDLAGPNPVVDPGVVCGYVITSLLALLNWVRRPRTHPPGTPGRDADGGLGKSAIARPLGAAVTTDPGSHGLAAGGKVGRGGESGSRRSHFPALMSRCQDTSVSTLWTPGGEHDPEEPEPGPAGDPPTPGVGRPRTTRAARGSRAEAGARAGATPVADIVANHAIGLWQLASCTSPPEEGSRARPGRGRPRHRRRGRARRGPGRSTRPAHGAAARALAQLRLAFVEISRRAES